jgi:5-methylcytosine-specific restriction endonuclease McrA
MRRKVNEGPPVARGSGGSGRARVVLSIVVTDSSFAKVRIPGPSVAGETAWVGKCIHCNKKLVVTLDGKTDATIEHISPRCNGGEVTDPRNLALACRGCNNEKGVRHDPRAGRGGRADEVIAALQKKRDARWQEPPCESA